jgi:hypothetical protein
VAEKALSREFLLVAACCRWPIDGAAIRRAAGGIDGPAVLNAAVRQRAVALVHHALQAAEIDVSATVAASLAQRAERIAAHNSALAAETARLQQALNAAGIPALALKGVALAKLAYGTLNVKHTRDIDLLVLPRHAAAALRLIEDQGYALFLPAPILNEAQRRAVIRYGKDVELVRDDIRVELQWRVATNAQLLQRVDAGAASQEVMLDGTQVRTLAEPDLFAYLCVHGAGHFWSRLKWLADVNALIAQKDEAQLAALYRHAQMRGAGLCAGQALLLCRKLLGLRIPAELAEELQHSRRLKNLVTMAMSAMARADPVLDHGIVAVVRGVFAQFLLGRGTAFFVEQCRAASVNLGDVIRLPLPWALWFLYPLLRLPLWLARRARLALRFSQR